MEPTNTGSKVAGVADLPFKLNLQLFGEVDEPTNVEVPVDAVDVVEPNSEVENDESTVEDTEETVTPEVVEPDQKPKQDSETNKAFQEMRHKLQETERLATRNTEIARKFGAEYGVFSDADIASKYGQSHGIHTMEQLANQIQMEAYMEKGIDPDEIKQIVDNHPDLVQARKVAYEQNLMSNFNDLKSEYPDIVKQGEDISPEVWARWNNGQSGLSLTDAFTLVNRKDILAKQQAAVKQANLNNLNSKNHMKPNGATGGTMDLTQIPDDVMSSYRKMFSSEIKKGTMKESDFIKHYKASQK